MASAAELGTKRKRDDLMCLVCGEAQADAFQAECGHVVTCFPCAFRIFAEEASYRYFVGSLAVESIFLGKASLFVGAR